MWIPRSTTEESHLLDGEFEGQREKADSAQNAPVIGSYRHGGISALTSPLKDPPAESSPATSSRQADWTVAQNYLTYEVLPNVPGRVNLAGVENIPTISTSCSLASITSSIPDRLFSRVALSAMTFPPRLWIHSSPLVSRITAQNAVLSETHIFSPSVLNEAKLGYNRNGFSQRYPDETNFDPESIGLAGIQASIRIRATAQTDIARNGLVPMNVTGYLTIGDSGLIPDFNLSTTWQLVDNLTINRGVHTFKMGFDFRRLRMDREASNNARGFFNFNGQASGSAAADFVLGFPSQSETPSGILPVQYRQHTYAAFVQDEWKLARNLTVNLGMRFEDIGET